MFCENCGKKLNDDSRFCENCGTENKVDSLPKTTAKTITKTTSSTGNKSKIILIASVCIIALIFVFSKGMGNKSIVGKWSAISGASGTIEFFDNGQADFNGDICGYTIAGKVIIIEGAWMNTSYTYSISNNVLTLDRREEFQVLKFKRMK